jgi:LacI family transcriptional regulator
MYLPFQADEGEVQRVLERCTTWRLDGALVVGLSDDHIAMLRDEMAQDNRPVAFVGGLPPVGGIGAYSDDESGWRLALQHLVGLGHKRVAHLGASPTSRLAQRRPRLVSARRARVRASAERRQLDAHLVERLRFD